MVTYSTSALSKETLLKFFHLIWLHITLLAFLFHPIYLQGVWFFGLVFFFPLIFWCCLFFVILCISSQNETSTDIPGHNHFRCEKKISSSHVSPTEQSRHFGYQILTWAEPECSLYLSYQIQFLKGEEVSLIALLKVCVREREGAREGAREREERGTSQKVKSLDFG